MRQGVGHTEPTCSVVIATRDRPARLAACLESLAAQDYPRERFEVIVVEDGGQSGTPRVGARYRGRLQLRTLERPFAGRSAARNQGAAGAGGELVAFTDDDTEPEPGWLRALATRHAALPGDALGGRTVAMSATNPYARVGGLILDLAYSHRSSHLPRGARFFAANNLALPADRFRMLGGLQPAAGHLGGPGALRPVGGAWFRNDLRPRGGDPPRNPHEPAGLLPQAIRLWTRSVRLPEGALASRARTKRIRFVFLPRPGSPNPAGPGCAARLHLPGPAGRLAGFDGGRIRLGSRAGTRNGSRRQ